MKLGKLRMLVSMLAMVSAATAAMPSVAMAAGKSVQITISTKGEELAFDKTKLNAKPGQTIKLTFKNAGNMQHNWVLVKPGTESAVSSASISAGGASGWLAKTPDVLASTKLVDPKKSDTVEFQAPTQPGEYPFICTFPGHYVTMKGILVVK